MSLLIWYASTLINFVFVLTSNVFFLCPSQEILASLGHTIGWGLVGMGLETEATVNAVKDVTLHGVFSYILVISMHPKDEPHDCGDSTERVLPD